jgi:hypothetical protein
MSVQPASPVPPATPGPRPSGPRPGFPAAAGPDEPEVDVRRTDPHGTDPHGTDPYGTDPHGTGDPDAALTAELDRLDDLPLAEHPAVYARLHEGLTERLRTTGPSGQQGSGQPGPGPARPFSPGL